jgi:hypothetical protein
MAKQRPRLSIVSSSPPAVPGDARPPRGATADPFSALARSLEGVIRGAVIAMLEQRPELVRAALAASAGASAPAEGLAF